MNLRQSAFLLALHACACLPGHAQTTEPPDLTLARGQFLRQVMSESQLLTEQYERALGRAEAELASTGAYEEAAAIRQRRDQLSALYAGTASSLATPLLLSQARMTGSAQASGETLSGWRSAGSGAEWANFRLLPGRYHLEFEVNMSDAPVAGSIYASSKFQPQQSASFEFHEVTLLGDSTENRRTFEITRSADETTFTTVRAGPLTFTRNPITLHFSSTSGYPANIIRIRNLRLLPVTEETTPPESPAVSTSSAAAALQAASARLKTALDSARTQAASSYVAALQALSTSTPALSSQADAEIRRIKNLGNQKTGPTGIRAIATAATGLNGFEDISDARLADDEPAAGDRFKVVVNGRTLSLRLLWIDCAPAAEGDAALKSFARWFKIEEEDALAVGRAAREFTSGYLRDKPLRLLVRSDRDKDGTLAALVFVPGVGLYQNVLVDHGLAAVTPPARDSRRNATEKALIATLVAREAAAKARRPAPGAWALSSDINGGRQP